MSKYDMTARGQLDQRRFRKFSGWLDIEMSKIRHAKYRKNPNIRIHLTCAIAITVLCYPIIYTIVSSLHDQDGKCWTCEQCHMSQWAQNTDWKGDYNCNNCKQSK